MADHEGTPPGSYAGPPETPQFGTEQFTPPQYPTEQFPQQPDGQPAYGQPAYGQPAYGQPAYGQPAYGQPAYGQPAYGQPMHGQPAYGPPYAPVPYGAPPGYGYPPPGYGYPLPYPPAPAGPQRPGLVTASAVLGYINAGLLLLGGALLLFGAAIVSDVEDSLGGHTNYDTEFAIDAFVNFLAAGLIIAGAVMFTGRKPVGRILLAAGNGVVVAACVYWIVRFNDTGFSDVSGYIVWTVLYGALAILPLAFSFTSDITRWLKQPQT